MPALTFRVFFLGGGLAAFGSVLAEIYYFKVCSLICTRLANQSSDFVARK